MTSLWRRLVIAPAALAVLAAPLAVATAANAADTDVRINEVGMTGTDFIEVVNTGAAPVDVSAWVVKDDNDTRTRAFPAGTVLQPGGFAAIDTNVDPGGFGLGNADAARLYLADGSTLIDSHTWTTPTETSYGRDPDGTGEFTTTAAATRGAANSFAPAPADVLRISEIESDGGTPGDWIELVNTSTLPVGVTGVVVSDGDDANAFAIPAGTTVAAGAYLVIEQAQLGFGLGGTDGVRLFTPGTPTTGTPFDAYSWTAHAAVTYGRTPAGTFATTDAPTKGAANTFPVAAGTADVTINEVESNGGTPGDWVELYNTGSTAVDLTGWSILDSDDTHTRAPLPAGSSIPAGGFFVVEEAQLGFGLGGADSVRLYPANASAPQETYSWTTHASTTYGRVPDGTGAFITTNTVTKAAPNTGGLPLLINEIESSGGAPVDWVELVNTSASTLDVSGVIIRDDDDAHVFTVPAGTSIESGGYRAFDVDVTGGFGLGGADAVRLYTPDGDLLDSYAWTTHATTTYGRCPDTTGAFATTSEPTKNLRNVCAGDVAPIVTEPWPGAQEVAAVDAVDLFSGDLSGLASETTADGDVLWAVQNGDGLLYQLVRSGGEWVPAPGWTGGTALRYPDGTGVVDAEGVVVGPGGSAAGGVFVSSERDNAANSVSRPSVLRYDVTGSAATMSASREWNLAADFPGLGANLGLEGVAYIPDATLTAAGFVDASTAAAYAPAAYPAHFGGVFFIAVEGTGDAYGYVLTEAGAFTRIATIDTGRSAIAELEYDALGGRLLIVCDEACDGQITPYTLKAGAFEAGTTWARPTGVANIANEGFALAGACVAGERAAFWADDADTSETGGAPGTGNSLREGALDCTTPGTGSGDGDGGAGDGSGDPVPGTGTGAGSAPGSGADGGPSRPGAGTAAGSGLAFTGAEVGVTVGAALALLAAGALLVAMRARRRSN